VNRSPIRLRFETLVAASPDQVWSRVSTMQGVNAELLPILRMTYPPALSNLDSAPPELLGKLAFKSWVLLLGWLPVDRHFLSLEALYSGQGFDERSQSWSQKVWIHRRRLQKIPEGTSVVDELEFEPRLGFAAPFLRWFIARVFAHRHRQLQRQFGVAS
jgi:hypothetical protein